MPRWFIPRCVWGYGLSVWMVQGQVKLPHPSFADQESPAGGQHAAIRLSMDLQPCRLGGSSPSRCRQAGRQRWILPCCNHLLSMAPRQNPPTHLLFLFLTLFHSCSLDSMNGVVARLLGLWRARTLYPKMEVGQCSRAAPSLRPSSLRAWSTKVWFKMRHWKRVWG